MCLHPVRSGRTPRPWPGCQSHTPSVGPQPWGLSVRHAGPQEAAAKSLPRGRRPRLTLLLTATRADDAGGRQQWFGGSAPLTRCSSASERRTFHKPPGPGRGGLGPPAVLRRTDRFRPAPPALLKFSAGGPGRRGVWGTVPGPHPLDARTSALGQPQASPDVAPRAGGGGRHRSSVESHCVRAPQQGPHFNTSFLNFAV